MTALRSVASSRSSFARSRPVRRGVPPRLGGELTAVAIINYYHAKQWLLKSHALSFRAERLGRATWTAKPRWEGRVSRETNEFNLTVEARVTQCILRDQSPCVRSFTSFRMTAHE